MHPNQQKVTEYNSQDKEYQAIKEYQELNNSKQYQWKQEHHTLIVASFKCGLDLGP